MFQTYRFGDLEVEAVKLTAENVDELEKLTYGVKVDEFDAFDSSKTNVGLNVPTHEGMRRASEGRHYVVRWQGFFYVRVTDWFEKNWVLTDAN